MSSISQDLRHSAAFDEDPWYITNHVVFSVAESYKDESAGQFMRNLSHDDLRTFYLLVAEALESS